MRQSKRRKKSLVKAIWDRIFCHRNIIIISDHKTDHIPFSTTLQLSIIAGILGFVGWVSYSTGSYMAAQSVLQEKERKIVSTNLENRRIESEFELLKRDLVTLAENDKKDMSEYTKFVIDQYKEGEEEGNPAIDVSKVESLNNGVVLERIAFLEEKVQEMRNTHEAIIEEIRDTTKGKIDELEEIIETTGLDRPIIEKRAERSAAKRNLASHNSASNNAPQGGPFDPIKESGTLIEKDARLYDDLKRMMFLKDVVSHLPLAKPMKNFRMTSGFGVRIDPFRKRLANHKGVDFVGKTGAQILCTNDGIVKRAKRIGAYGFAVEVQHEYGISTLYGHMSKILVKEGQKVSKGDVLGIQGSTGRSTGQHLHYEVRYNGTQINPKNFLEAGDHVRKKQN